MGKYDILIGLGAVAVAGFLFFTPQGKQIFGELQSKLQGIIPSFGGYGGWQRQQGVGAYAVDLRNLPYDPNNYYAPPRDRSIMP